jgi:MoaA/NifB/PqqE/SkfB family radical SAM enzyme
MKNYYGWQLYHWHIEPSSKCALRCPRCPRTELPDTPWLNLEISLDVFKQTFTPDFISEHVQRFTMCGDVGDPIYCKDYLEIVQYIKTIKPTCHVFTVTNGSYKTKDWWLQFAEISNEHDTINFSVDGYDQESNNLYRVNNDFDSIMTGMKIMGHQSLAFVYWAAIYFNFNENHQDNIRSLAAKNGCDGVQWTKSTKFNSKYNKAYGDVDTLEPSPQYISSTHRYERHVDLISNRTINNSAYMQTNLTKYQAINKTQHIVPLCMIGNRGMFLNAEGVVHPCSWVSFPYESLTNEEKTIHYKDSFFTKYRNNLNINLHSLEEIMNSPLWQKLFDSWQQDPWVECSLKCSNQYITQDYAVGYETN